MVVLHSQAVQPSARNLPPLAFVVPRLLPPPDSILPQHFAHYWTPPLPALTLLQSLRLQP
ncbi:hypothetical protein BO70DRAFT_365366, partial [Aspergillus heteromorphus CBS 117.55]